MWRRMHINWPLKMSWLKQIGNFLKREKGTPYREHSEKMYGRRKVPTTLGEWGPCHELEGESGVGAKRLDAEEFRY